jgi:hypothetical protein
LLWPFVDEVEGHAGLHVDERDVVGQDVVQLLGHAEALLALASPLLLGPVAGGVRDPFALYAYEVGDDEDHEQPRRHAQRRAELRGLLSAEQAVEHEVAGIADSGADPRRRAVAIADRAEDGDHEGEDERPVGVVERVIQQRRPARDGEDSDGMPSTRHEGQGAPHEQHDGEGVDRAGLGLMASGDVADAELEGGDGEGEQLGMAARPPARRRSITRIHQENGRGRVRNHSCPRGGIRDYAQRRTRHRFLSVTRAGNGAMSRQEPAGGNDQTAAGSTGAGALVVTSTLRALACWTRGSVRVSTPCS